MTKIEQAIELIRKKGSARTPDIAAAIGVKTNSVMALLSKPVEDEYLVTCKVTTPGCHPVTEYRLSACVSESNVSWAEHKERCKNKLAIKPIKNPKERPPRVALSGPVRDIPSMARSTEPSLIKHLNPHANETIDVPFQKQPEAPAIAISGEEKTDTLQYIFMVDCDGKLRIKCDGQDIVFNNEHTRRIGELLVATEPIWG